jgi:ketosteroid isomerase-like protein
MSQENVEIVRAALRTAAERGQADAGMRIDALNRAATDAIDELLFDAEVEFQEDPRFPEAGVFHGRAAVRAYFDQFTDQFDEFSFGVDDVLDAGGDDVLVLCRLRGRGNASGAEFDQRSAWLFSVRAGRAYRVRPYFDRAEGLEAVGLSE